MESKGEGSAANTRDGPTSLMRALRQVGWHMVQSPTLPEVAGSYILKIQGTAAPARLCESSSHWPYRTAL